MLYTIEVRNYIFTLPFHNKFQVCFMLFYFEDSNAKCNVIKTTQRISYSTNMKDTGPL